MIGETCITVNVGRSMTEDVVVSSMMVDVDESGSSASSAQVLPTSNADE